jgi:hypothetical protein
MTTSPNREIDWSRTTWKGCRREQHQQHLALTLREKLQSLEDLCDMGRRTLESRRRRGLPYIDPHTDKRVPGRPSSGE